MNVAFAELLSSSSIKRTNSRNRRTVSFNSFNLRWSSARSSRQIPNDSILGLELVTQLSFELQVPVLNFFRGLAKSFQVSDRPSLRRSFIAQFEHLLRQSIHHLFALTECIELSAIILEFSLLFLDFE